MNPKYYNLYNYIYVCVTERKESKQGSSDRGSIERERERGNELTFKPQKQKTKLLVIIMDVSKSKIINKNIQI